ncbi:16547_t:CDS:2, partial [Funneliformis mosseae]
NKIFYTTNRVIQNIKDPFRPLELNDKSRSKIGTPSKLSSKPRKPNRFNLYKKLSSDTFSIQQRKIKRIHNIKQNYNSFDVNNQQNNMTITDNLYKNSCLYCDEELPNILPEKLQIKLLSLQNNPITEYDRYSFCVMHHAVLHIILNDARYFRLDYGSKGLYCIANVLIDLFITSDILILLKAFSLKPIDYIYEVLIPKVTSRLIKEDYNNNITLENVRKIMVESIEFEEYLHCGDDM